MGRPRGAHPLVSVRGARARRPLLLLALPILAAAPAGADGIDCPRGTEHKGAPPPADMKEWCQRTKDRAQHGPSVFYYPNGARKAEAHFEDGKLDGPYKEWHENGKLAVEGSYHKDHKDGTFTSYYEDGTRGQLEHYKDGVLDGVVQSWWRNGKLQLDAAFEDGKRDGLAVTYYENGQKKTEGHFKDGRHDGRWTGWYEDGSPEKVAVFENGVEVSRQEFPPKAAP